MIKKMTLLWLFISLISAAWAQGRHRPVIQGIVTSGGTPLAGASIIVENTSRGASTNKEGRFQITGLHPGKYVLVVSAVGFTTAYKQIELGDQDLDLSLELIQSEKNLDAIEVFGTRNKQPEKLDVITRMPLQPKDQLQTISVISDKLIAKQGNLTVIEATRNVPGVYTYSRYGNSSESISSRGYRGIPIYKNGVRIGTDPRGFGFITDLGSVESIQVIKGSNAVTMGAATDLGSPGGLINVVTKTPKFVNAGQISVRGGGFGQVRPTFDIQQVLDKAQTIAFRINGGYENARDYHKIKNVGVERFFINPSFEWRPDEKTTITLEMDYLNDSRTLDAGTVNADPKNETNQIVELPKDKLLGFINSRQYAKTRSYAARIRRNIAPNLYIRGAFYGVTFDQNATRTSLSAIRYDSARNILVNRFTNTIFQRSIGQDGNSTEKNSVLQFDLVGQDIWTGPLKHTFMAGVDFTATDVTSRSVPRGGSGGSFVIDTIDITKNFSNKLPKGTKPAFTGLEESRRITKNVGFTIQDVIQLTRWVRVYGSLRYTHVESTVPATTGAADYRSGFWNPLAGAMFTINKHINAFVSYTNSTKTPFNYATNPLDKDGNELGNERNDQLEIGLKSAWFNDRLRFNLTGYKINNKNMNLQASVLNPATGFIELQNYYIKGGNDERKGIEVELAGRILENIEMIIGYSYISAKFKEHTTFVKNSSPNNTPSHTANAWISYTVQKGPLKRLNLSAGAYYLGKRPYNDWTQKNVEFHGIQPNLKPWYNKAYTIVTAQLGYDINKNWSIRGYVNNVFDAVGFDAYRTSFIDRIEPRNISGTITYRF